MNPNQFTQKSLEAIQGAQDIAQEYGNQQIEQINQWKSVASVGSVCDKNRSKLPIWASTINRLTV